MSNTSVNDFSYAAVSILVGPRFKYDVLPELELFAMPVIGSTGFATSGWEMTYGTSSRDKLDLNYNSGISYGISGGLRTTGTIGILVELSYLSLGQRTAAATITETRPTLFGTATRSTTIDIKQTIAWLSANVGLSISF